MSIRPNYVWYESVALCSLEVVNHFSDVVNIYLMKKCVDQSKIVYLKQGDYSNYHFFEFFSTSQYHDKEALSSENTKFAVILQASIAFRKLLKYKRAITQ